MRRTGIALAALLGCAPAAPDGEATALRFTDVAAEAGIDVVNWCGSDLTSKPTILESMGSGAAWLDDDGDGLLDLFVVNGSSNGPLPDPPPTSRMYRNRGDGTFDDVTERAGVGDSAWGNGVAAADCDDDGDTDLFVANWGPHILYRNAGDGTYRDVAREAGVDATRADGRRHWGAGAAWGDVDRDGALDLFVAHYLFFDPEHPPNGGRTQIWKGIRDAFIGPQGTPPQQDALFRNRGDGTFEDVTDKSGIGAVPPAYGLGGIFTDVDLDGDADLYVANDSMPNSMFVNDGSGRFTDEALLMGLAYAEHGNAQASMGLDAADFEGDGDDDLLVTNFVYDVNTLYRNDGARFTDVTTPVGLGAPGRNLLCWGCGMFDLDLDGDRDVFIAAGHLYPMAEVDAPSSGYFQRDQLLEHRDGRLVEVGAHAGPAFERLETSRAAAFGDHDGDGDVDVFVVNLNRTPTLYRNDSPRAGRWLAVRLVGAASNRDGVGARVTVVAGGRSFSAERRAGASYFSTNSPWLHFGLGPVERVERVTVRWPSGAVTEHGPFDPDRRVTLRERN